LVFGNPTVHDQLSVGEIMREANSGIWALCHTSLRNRFLLSSVICTLLIGLSCSSGRGAPVKFKFDAEIRNVADGNPFNLPLTYEVGDIIFGSFIFEPNSGNIIGGNRVVASQPFAFEFDINGTVVATSGFRIEVFNDTAIDDSGFPEPIDVTTLGCSEPTCIPDLVILAEGEPFRVRTRMQLIGSEDVVLAPEISSDPATWNAFELKRSLVLAFDNDGPGSMGFDAVVGSMVQVPEPISIASLALAATIAASCQSLRRVR
jgi:hypothetical protein